MFTQQADYPWGGWPPLLPHPIVTECGGREWGVSRGGDAPLRGRGGRGCVCRLAPGVGWAAAPDGRGEGPRASNVKSCPRGPLGQAKGGRCPGAGGPALPGGDGGRRGREHTQKPEMLFYLHHKSDKLSDEVQTLGSGWRETGSRPDSHPHGTERE